MFLSILKSGNSGLRLSGCCFISESLMSLIWKINRPPKNKFITAVMNVKYLNAVILLGREPKKQNTNEPRIK